MKQKLFTLLLALVGLTAQAWATGGTLEGTGAQDDPYMIVDAQDWAAFAAKVNGGETSACAILMADITEAVSAMVGTNGNRYSGRFDGLGHTLTIGYGTAASPLARNDVAPFSFVRGGTIRGLHTVGDIYVSGKFAAGIVSEIYGTGNVVERCRCSVVIHCYTAGDGTHGGVAGIVNTGAEFRLSSTFFDGKLLSEGETATTLCGGMVGYTRGTETIGNCLFAPAEVYPGLFRNTFSRYWAGFEPTVTNCYYTLYANDGQGTDGSALTAQELAAALGRAWEVAGGAVVPKPTSVSELALNLTHYDANGDGRLTIADLTMLANILVGKQSAPLRPVSSIVLSATEATIHEGESLKLDATVSPSDADYPQLAWSSSDEGVATVNPYGRVQAIGAGTCQIVCSAVDGSGVSATCTVTVLLNPFVNLGLPSGTLWATCNVGADNPEDYGLYFAWGETTGYTSDTNDGHSFDWTSYKYAIDNNNNLTKYCQQSSYGNDGFTDTLAELELSDDAAYVNWGSEWRMPSFDQIKELFNSAYTTTEWTTQNGVYGRKITSVSNNKSIFLPAAGCRYGTSVYGTGSDGYYWSRTLNSSHPYGAYYLYFNSGNMDRVIDNRFYGFSVRPVRVSQ